MMGSIINEISLKLYYNHDKEMREKIWKNKVLRIVLTMVNYIESN